MKLIVTIKEGIDTLKDFIYNIATYDIITIHASIHMYLIARKNKAMIIKMILSSKR